MAAAGRGEPGRCSWARSTPPPPPGPLRASSSAAGREPVGGYELLDSLANLLLHLVDSVSRDVAGLGLLVEPIVRRLDDRVDHLLGCHVVSSRDLGKSLARQLVLER